MVANEVNSASSHFGRQVKKARLARHWTLRELARQAGIDPGYLSHIENGRRAPSEAVAAKLDGVFPERDGWFSDWAGESRNWSEVPPAFKSWAEIESRAAGLRVWAPGIVHGLMQDEGYARVMLAAYPSVDTAVVNARLLSRRERQQRVLYRDDPPDIHVVVDEAALYRRVGSAEVMAAQMTRLIELAALDHVRLQVMPAIEHPCTGSEMIIADAAVYTESLVGGGTYTEPETLTRLSRLFATLVGECYRVSESRQLLERMRDTWIAYGARAPFPVATADRASKSAKRTRS